MKRKNEGLYWIIGIVLVLVVVTKLPMIPQFAIVQKTTCADNTISYWGFENNLLDSNNLNNGDSLNPLFNSGKIGNAVEFDTTNYLNFNPSSAYATVMWIKNYSKDNQWYFAAKIGNNNYVNGVLDNTRLIIPVGPNFGLGFNGSVDEIATFSNLSTAEMINFYNAGSGRAVCYTTSYEENVTCKDYATEMLPDKGYGCINYSGDFFPNCEYSWVDASIYEITNNVCERLLYCQSSCLEINGCYSSLQKCKENLEYECYVISDGLCFFKADYDSCISGTSYKNISACEDKLPLPTSPTSSTTEDTLTTTNTNEEEKVPTTLKEKLNSPIGLKLFKFEVKTLHLIALLIIIIAGFIIFSKNGSKAI